MRLGKVGFPEFLLLLWCAALLAFLLGSCTYRLVDLLVGP